MDIALEDGDERGCEAGGVPKVPDTRNGRSGATNLVTGLNLNSFFFFFLNSNFYPGWHPYGQAGWLSTTQVLKGFLLLESGSNREGEKEIVR